MTLKVLYIASSGRIVQWQNTDIFGYPDDPVGMLTMEVTPEQYENSSIYKSVVAGALSEEDPVEIPFTPDSEQLAMAARAKRDGLLRSLYDPGILMAQRALRLASTPEETAYAEGKILELDLYAEALQGVPQQPGFPQSIDWPIAPNVEYPL